MLFLDRFAHLFPLSNAMPFFSLPSFQGKQRAKMRIWDFESSGAKTVKRNTPDLATPVELVIGTEKTISFKIVEANRKDMCVLIVSKIKVRENSNGRQLE